MIGGLCATGRWWGLVFVVPLVLDLYLLRRILVAGSSQYYAVFKELVRRGCLSKIYRSASLTVTSVHGL